MESFHFLEYWEASFHVIFTSRKRRKVCRFWRAPNQLSRQILHNSFTPLIVYYLPVTICSSVTSFNAVHCWFLFILCSSAGCLSFELHMLRIRAPHGCVSRRGLLWCCARLVRGPQLVPFLSDLGSFWRLFPMRAYVRIEGQPGATPRANRSPQFGQL